MTESKSVLEGYEAYIALTDKLYEAQDRFFQALKHREKMINDNQDPAWILSSVVGRFQGEIVHLIAKSVIDGEDIVELMEKSASKHTKKVCGCEQRHFVTPEPICKECDYDEFGKCQVCMHEKKCHPDWKAIYGRVLYEDEEDTSWREEVS